MLRAITVGYVSWGVAAALAFALWPEMNPVHDPAERLALAAELAVAPAFFSLLVVLACMRLFDRAEAEDPFSNAESQRWKINQRVLQNTVEQALLFLPALFGLAVRIDERHLRVLPVAVALWCSGRVLFWLGYHRSGVWRAPGFDWTLNSTLLVLGWFVATWF